MSQQTLIDVAKAPVLAYNAKDWRAVTRTLADGIVYDEVSARRRLRGIDDVLAAWKAWATAFPDSTATFEVAHVSGNTVILELTWRGTHMGDLRTLAGAIPATGRSIEMRACQIVEVAAAKAHTIRQYFDLLTMLEQLGISVAGA